MSVTQPLSLVTGARDLYAAANRCEDTPMPENVADKLSMGTSGPHAASVRIAWCIVATKCWANHPGARAISPKLTLQVSLSQCELLMRSCRHIMLWTAAEQRQSKDMTGWRLYQLASALHAPGAPLLSRSSWTYIAAIVGIAAVTFPPPVGPAARIEPSAEAIKSIGQDAVQQALAVPDIRALALKFWWRMSCFPGEAQLVSMRRMGSDVPNAVETATKLRSPEMIKTAQAAMLFGEYSTIISRPADFLACIQLAMVHCRIYSHCEYNFAGNAIRCVRELPSDGCGAMSRSRPVIIVHQQCCFVVSGNAIQGCGSCADAIATWFTTLHDDFDSKIDGRYHISLYNEGQSGPRIRPALHA
jgi:hypothetical protein